MNTLKLVPVVYAPDECGVSYEIDGTSLAKEFGFSPIDAQDFLYHYPFSIEPTPEVRQVIIGNYDNEAAAQDNPAVVAIQEADGLFIWGEVTEEEDLIPEYTFEPAQYLSAVQQFKESAALKTPFYETISKVYAGIESIDLERFRLETEWVSSKIKPNSLSIALRYDDGVAPYPYQVVLHFPWNANDRSVTAAAMIAELKKSPDQWSDVLVYVTGIPFDQAVMPKIGGPKWKWGFTG